MMYRKRGVVVRWENGTLIRVHEHGIAREDGARFECEPSGERTADLAFEPADLPAVAAMVRDAAGGIAVERLVLVDGRAEHEYGDHRWSEMTKRLHLALVHSRIRVLVDLATFDVAEIAGVATAMRMFDAGAEWTPAAMRVAPNVTAALLPLYTGRAPGGCRIVQAAGGVDGYGQPVVAAEGEWPNAFRPSYRARPRRMPMNLRMEGAADPIDASLPRAVAFLGTAEDGRVSLLLEDGGRSWRASIRIDHVRAVAPDARWYPYAAGSFGAEMML